MGEAKDKVRRVTALITEKISYERWKDTYLKVAVCNCGDWESLPGDTLRPNDRDDMTREVWAHITAKHLDEAEPLANPDAQVIADTRTGNR